MSEIPQNSGNSVERNADGTFKEGHTKLGGKTLGTKNFETDFDEAVSEIAKENGMTRSEARKLLLKVAFKQAKDGNYSFYKDIHDRIYGQPKSTNDVNVGGEILQILVKRYDDTDKDNTTSQVSG